MLLKWFLHASHANQKRFCKGLCWLSLKCVGVKCVGLKCVGLACVLDSRLSPSPIVFSLSVSLLSQNILPLVVEEGLTSFALVPMGTNALTYKSCLDIRTKNSGNGLIRFQCIPVGNAALTYECFDLRTPFHYGLRS